MLVFSAVDHAWVTDCGLISLMTDSLSPYIRGNRKIVGMNGIGAMERASESQSKRVYIHL